MSLIKGIKSQVFFMIQKKGFKIAMTCNILFNMVSYLYQVYKATGNYSLEVLSTSYACSVSSENLFWVYYQILFPFIVVMPYAFSYFEDKSLKLTYYIETRMEKRKYLISKVVASFIGSFIIVILPFLLNILLNEITFPHNRNVFGGNLHAVATAKDIVGETIIVATIQKELIGLKVFLAYPQFYNILLILLLAIIAGVMGAFCFCWSYFIEKYKVLLFLPVYLFCYAGNILTTMSEKVGYYLDFTLLDYASLNTYIGKNVIILLMELSIMIVFIFVTTYQEIKKKQ